MIIEFWRGDTGIVDMVCTTINGQHCYASTRNTPQLSDFESWVKEKLKTGNIEEVSSWDYSDKNEFRGFGWHKLATIDTDKLEEPEQEDFNIHIILGD